MSDVNSDLASSEPPRDVRLVLIRHGESVWNAERRVQGQLGTGLTAQGRSQATTVADYLRRTFPEPAVVFSSDLERVVQTSQPYLSASGQAAEFDKRLREIDTGAWSGLLVDDAIARFPDEHAAFSKGEDVARGGGETFAQMRDRFAAALGDIGRTALDRAPAESSSTAIVFTHGGPIGVTVATILGMPLTGKRPVDSVENCSVTVLRATPVDDETAATAAGAGFAGFSWRVSSFNATA